MGQSRLVVRNWLAEGAYGLVYTAVMENSVSPQASSYLGQVVVIKQLLCQAQEQVDEAHHELSLLRKLRGHPGIISLLDYASIAVSSSPVRRQVLLIFPYYSLGSAAQLAENHAVEEVQALFLTYHLAQTLLFLHEQGYTHRDVKPHNLLLTAPTTSEEVQLGLGRPVLLDFGSVAPARQTLSSRQDALNCEEEASRKTSLAYRAPELVAVPSPRKQHFFFPSPERKSNHAYACVQHAQLLRLLMFGLLVALYLLSPMAVDLLSSLPRKECRDLVC